MTVIHNTACNIIIEHFYPILTDEAEVKDVIARFFEVQEDGNTIMI